MAIEGPNQDSMDEDTFLAMVSDELKHVKENYLLAEDEFSKLKSEHPTDDELTQKNYILMVLGQRRAKLEELQDFPAYARFNAASDIEKRMYQTKSQAASRLWGDGYKSSKKLGELTEPLDSFTNLVALVSLDPAKAQEMAKLLTKYKALCSEQRSVSGSLSVDSCPEALKQRLSANPYIYNKETGEVTAPGELIPIVKEFKAYFDGIKNKFKRDFDERKLLELLEKRDCGNLAADVVFLRGKSEVLDELSSFVDLINEKESPSKKSSNPVIKIIKKVTNKGDRAEELDKAIADKRAEIYSALIKKYEDYHNPVLGINTGVNFASRESLMTSLNSCMQNINMYERAINEVETNLEKMEEEMKASRESYNPEIEAVYEEIRNLSGKTDDFEMPVLHFIANTEEDNLQKIAKARNLVFVKGLVSRILFEAQRLANEAKAKLSEPSVEESLSSDSDEMGPSPKK